MYFNCGRKKPEKAVVFRSTQCGQKLQRMPCEFRKFQVTTGKQKAEPFQDVVLFFYIASNILKAKLSVGSICVPQHMLWHPDKVLTCFPLILGVL